MTPSIDPRAVSLAPVRRPRLRKSDPTLPELLRRLAQRPRAADARSAYRFIVHLARAPAAEPVEAGKGLTDAVLLVSFFRVADAWRLDDPSLRILLGGVADSALAVWRHNHWRKMPMDVVDRIRQMLRIHLALALLLRDQTPAEWLNRPLREAPCHGQTPLAFLSTGRIRELYGLADELEARVRQLPEAALRAERLH